MCPGTPCTTASTSLGNQDCRMNLAWKWSSWLKRTFKLIQRSFLGKNCHLEYSSNSLKLKSWYVMPIQNVSEKAFIFLIENYPENAFKGDIIKLILHENYCLDRNLLSNQLLGLFQLENFGFVCSRNSLKLKCWCIVSIWDVSYKACIWFSNIL